VQHRQERAEFGNYIDRLKIKTSSQEQRAGNLSGGNQQKVALARWLAIRPSVLILDEPTQGVDVGSKSEIHRIMVDLAEQGVAIHRGSVAAPGRMRGASRLAPATRRSGGPGA
jgi:rhamnose transport system ATP-binding protein